MTGFMEFLTAAAKIWGQHPVEFIGALAVGVLLGFFLVRLRYKSVIEAQKIHLDIKDESIKMKDAAIAGASASAPRLDAAIVQPAPSVVPAVPQVLPPSKPPAFGGDVTVAAPPKAEAKPKQSSDDPRFRDINERIIGGLDDKIYLALGTTRYKLVFNPETGRSKNLSFNESGEIGEGRNDNEHRWRVTGGRLEILDSKGRTYSRFFLLPDGRSMHHTNDEDTRSIKGQYLVPA